MLTAQRQRSQDEPPKVAKRTKFQATETRSFSEVLKDPLVVAVVDGAQEDGSITRANWKKVEEALASSFFTILRENPGAAPSCRDGGWNRNHTKLTGCANQGFCTFTRRLQVAYRRFGLEPNLK